ncbi:MAG: NUDIX hydrolase [Bacteroidales bacterium]|nr:NUDIX hydrolase [Bacteroidales bacterium]
MPYTYPYPRPAVTVDAVVFRINEGQKEVLLIQRGHPPFENQWALPGGFVDMDENLETAAARELKEETGLKNIDLQQFHTFGNPGRDPRHRTISIAHWGELIEPQELQAGDDARNAQWFSLYNLPETAFDHKEIIAMAKEIWLKTQ